MATADSSSARHPTVLLLIGAQKAGTQSLAHYLAAQPRVSFTPHELNFFSNDSVWARGLDWYRSQISDPAKPDALVVGETSPSYSMQRGYPQAARRIGSTLPDARLVYLLRDPIERMRSAYQHALAAGWEQRPMREALLADDTYLDPSLYATQLERYAEVLSRKQVLLVESERLRRDRIGVVADVLRFAGVADAVAPLPDSDRNVTAMRRVPRRWAVRAGDVIIRHEWADRVPRRVVRWRERESWLLTRPFRPEETAVTPQLRQELASRLRADVAALRMWLGPDFHGWGLLD